MTVKEAVAAAMEKLIAIPVPGKHIRDIGIPILEIEEILSASIDAMERAEKESTRGETENGTNVDAE